MKKAVLFGPFVGELYWEAGRFAPMLPFYKLKKYKEQNVKYIVFTREERFDLYGKYADIFVPQRIEGDYEKERQPNCFRLNGLRPPEYLKIVKKFRNKYEKIYNIVEHVYPDVKKPIFLNKNQFNRKNMIFQFQPRFENYVAVNHYIPTDKPLVILSPRYRIGFKRNWNKWPEFYNTLYKDKSLIDNFNFVICGKKGEYIPDEKHRFYDMNDIEITRNSSLIGLLLVLMEKAIFTFGSQSAIPNIALLYGVEVLEFGCQNGLHTKTYNIKNTPITFIDDRNYEIGVTKIFNEFKRLLQNKKRRK